MKSTLSRLYLNSCHPNPNVSPTPLLQKLLETQRAHGRILKSGFPVEEYQLVQAYCNCKAFGMARQLFDEMWSCDLVSATAIVGCFARHNHHGDAVILFRRLLLLDLRPNEFTLSTVLYAATALRDLILGRQLHSDITKLGLPSNVYVGSALLDHYAKLGCIGEARTVFAEIGDPNVVSYTALISGLLRNEMFDDALWLFKNMPERNAVSWNAVIGGCSQIGLNEESVNLFVEMCREGVKPNQSTFPCLFTAAANIAALGMGKSIHAASIKCLNRLEVYVGNALISFYAKCGCPEDSILAFDGLRDRNIVSWNAVISGCAQNGRGNEALEFYKMMRVSGLKPNDVSLLGLLFGCNHAGLVDVGFMHFKLTLAENPAILRAEHYACIVNLLSRSGRFAEAERFLNELPFDPGIGFWKALLGGCQIHLNREVSEVIARHIQALDPEDVSSYVMLSNVYSAAGSWQGASQIRRQMKDKGMERIPGCSWIEIRNEVHIFLTGDRSHIQTDEIHRILKICLTS